MKSFAAQVVQYISSLVRKSFKDSQNKKEQGFFTKLIDDDNDFSTLNFFLIAMTFIGIFMLLVPMGGLIVDIIYNHTITINMSDLATYILAVSGIFGVAGLSNAWSEYSWNKYGANIFNNEAPDLSNIGNNSSGNKGNSGGSSNRNERENNYGIEIEENITNNYYNEEEGGGL